MECYGYAWLPEGLEGENEQREAFYRFGLADGQIYEDRQIGSKKERKELKRLIKKCRRNDLILVKNLDRLGASYEQLRDNWLEIVAVNEINICVLDTPMIDTRRDRNLVSSIVISMLDYMSNSSRTGSHNIQQERVTAAIKRGVRFGRPRWQPTPEFETVYGQVKSGEISLGSGADILGIPKSTFRSRIKSYEALKGKS